MYHKHKHRSIFIFETAKLFADGARDIINKVKSAFGIETVSKVEDGIRYLEIALATRGTKALTSGAGVQYNIDDSGINQHNEIKVHKVKMRTFSPYNESQSDTNEIATRWAHNENVEAGAQTIVFHMNQCYLIEKYDSSDLGY